MEIPQGHTPAGPSSETALAHLEVVHSVTGTHKATIQANEVSRAKSPVLEGSLPGGRGLYQEGVRTCGPVNEGALYLREGQLFPILTHPL